MYNNSINRRSNLFDTLSNERDIKLLKLIYKNFLIGSGISILLWILYLQFSPKIGNIWIRDNSRGERTFVPYNILNMVFYTVNNIDFWYPWNWDMNPFIWILIGNSIVFLYKYYI